MRAPLVSVLLLLSCAWATPPARAAERVGDALALYALRDRTQAVAALESEILALIEASPEEDRFELYRTSNALTGAWVQVRLSQSLIDQAMTAASPSDEETIRTALRDQALFALWELDEARLYLERNAPGADRWQHARLNEAMRSLLADTGLVYSRLLAAR
jgi:hypothetical protein